VVLRTCLFTARSAVLLRLNDFAPRNTGSVNCTAFSDSMNAMGSRLSFLMNYLSSGREFCQLYPFWKLPLCYAFGVMYVLLKLLLLNPPFLTRLQSTLRLEIDGSFFPAETITDRLAFAKRWHSMEPRREPPFLGNIGSRFTHLADRNIWMEQLTFGLPPSMMPPAMSSSGIFDESTGAWQMLQVRAFHRTFFSVGLTSERTLKAPGG
jgi:hypothetical protein